jgi:hypothetical protein
VAVPKGKQRRMRVPIKPPVVATIREHRVTFVGLNLLNGAVMVEYEVDPPLGRESHHWPHFLSLLVTDDVSDDVYPTSWEDFAWPEWGPGRATTRLDQRPPAEARKLHIDVLPVDERTPAVLGPGSVKARAVARFDVELPPEHGMPWASAGA